uniref:TNFR-Cys domain-containing protein n=1 Tax=Anabas testudineus TaxID=64144 RepID=A0A7N6FLP9_ANATE
MATGHSIRCSDLKTRWSRAAGKCVPCTIKPGFAVNPNCGFDDDGGRHEVPLSPCKANTFNDGSGAYCKPCTICSPQFDVISNCTSTTNTKCQLSRLEKDACSVDYYTLECGTKTHSQSKFDLYSVLFIAGAVPLTIFISILLVLSACPNILSAPLQTVLDNLDVLDELVILLDPESHGVKNTKHLASQCSFSSPWIKYTYSMRHSKSPLKAVLEGVTSRNPDWTVRHLATLLKLIERNDAVAVLAKLSENSIVV